MTNNNNNNEHNNMIIRTICLFFLAILFSPSVLNAQNATIDGYKGIWFTLGQFTEYGDKYSGGLGTYTADHLPIAIYAPEVKKTFFVYGGTTKADERHLLIMISYYDHVKKVVPKPVLVLDKETVNDPHDNAALSIDAQGYIWVFVSGRMRIRPGSIFKSLKPFDISGFEKIREDEMTYPQPWWVKGEGFLYLLTKYTNGRELYWSTSKDGKTWAPDQKLAGMGGHYQVTNMYGKKLVSVFNYHPGGNVDKRTNIYAVQTDDMGKTWKTVDGKVFTPPLSDHHNPALIYDFEAEHKLVYINDLGFDNDGDPVILAIVSRDFRPGPGGDPREWMIIHWKNGKWNFSKVCESDHNYDMGSLYIEKEVWRIFGPTDPGPQKWGAGGEMVVWESRDDGKTWEKKNQVTWNSTRNISYARRPLNANDDFYAYWADGDPDRLSESHLYFANRTGDVVRELPYNMEKEFQEPAIVSMNGRNKMNIPVVSQSAVKSQVYSVNVNGQEVFVEKYKSYNYCSLEVTSSFSVEVRSQEAISVMSVSPLNLNINQILTANSSKFTLPGPGYYALKINNTDRLFIFADLPEDQSVKTGILATGLGIDNTGKIIETENIQKAINSSAASGKILVFPAGIYRTGSLSVPSGTRIYLSAGSVISAVDDLSLLSFNDTIKPKSFIRIKDAKNVSIRGRGIIDANGRVLRDKYGDAARMRLLLILNSSDVNIDGIIARDPGSWNTHILYSDKIDIRNVKMLNDIDLSNTDGFDPDASRNVVIDHCFAYCSDDNVAVKTTGSSGYLRDAENIIVRNCVFLTKKSSLKVGTESLSANLKNIAFVNNDVIESDRGMSLYCADGATFDDIRFINNRFESNWPDAKRCGINFTITKRNQGSRAGVMKNILVRDCSFVAEFPRVSEILGFDKDHRISLTIENLKIGGKKCSGLLDSSIKTNEFSDLIFK
jgi:hypothetical protein